MLSILSAGTYVPRYRIARSDIVEANRWFAGGMGALAKGARAYANWDEDAVTMAVAAGRIALAGHDLPGDVRLASTTAPFADRQNAGLVAAALGLEEAVSTLDLGGSARCGTSGLAAAVRSEPAEGGPILLCAAEHRSARAGSSEELTSGDGAAALLLGHGEGIAKILGAAQRSVDFVDHYRAADREFNYGWEERWIRDEGYAKLVPPVVAEALAAAGLAGSDVDRFILPAPTPAIATSLAKRAGVREGAVADTLFATVGFTGAAHPLLMLAAALETAGAGERIVVVGFGQGVDVIVLETTSAAADHRPVPSFADQISRGLSTGGYMRYLAFNKLVEREHGIRAELDLQTAPTIMYRNRRMLFGFFGGKCDRCGAVQFPKTPICVNPNCGAHDSQHNHCFADTSASLQSFTADRLTYCPDPPALYGMVRFQEGGCLMMDITDALPDEVEAGRPLSMVFRIKAEDERRGIKRYFWKATPAAERV
ncbi:3-oxoacyl-[acyl-carrier-protein] synthase III C-terminal domain-containing protein [Amorphus sp. 3PC139-8]|uniref:3-oxoacyl-[acyl-carrier-protein] synthase III C-terminal domain-containing protein n=1 Tax=Amorphus sp. 3PC139-8 TaxID=2735676 RepID=UPI00345C8D7D